MRGLRLILPALAALAAGCGSLPRPDRVAKPAYISLYSDAHETLGEYYLIIPTFKIDLPETDPARRAYLEERVAEFSRVKLLKYDGYGADLTVQTNDRKSVAETLAAEGETLLVTPETLTLSAKYRPGKKPRLLVTASPNILSEDGTLHFTLTPYPPGRTGERRQRPKVRPAGGDGAGPEALAIADAGKAAELRAWLERKYGKAPRFKRSATVFNSAARPSVTIEAEITVHPDTARLTFSGVVRNLGAAPIWATYYLPQLTYRKGGDWYTFSARKFGDSLQGSELNGYYIGRGKEKKFQFSTDPELRVLVYDSAQRLIVERNAFSSKEQDDLLKLQILEKLLAGNPEVSLEVFPDKMICADCGVKFY